MKRIRTMLAASAILLAGCTAKPVITRQDSAQVLSEAIEFTYNHLSSKACLVTRLGDGRIPIPESYTGTNWQTLADDPLQRVRWLKAPTPILISGNLGRGFRTTSDLYGCPETIRLHKPTFAELEDHNKTTVTAYVDIDRLCGPVCGEGYSLTFYKKGPSWLLEDNKLPAPSVMF